MVQEKLRALNNTSMSGLTVSVLSLVLFILTDVHGVTIVTEPQNTTALENTDATLPCIVANQNFGEDVVWKKIVNGVTTTISTNSIVTGSGKYAIAGNYNLTIVNAAIADEGTYECSISNQQSLKKSATLTVASNITSMTLLWPGKSETASMGVQSNLTCTSVKSRPPASFRWYRGNMDITISAYNPTPTTDSNGFGSANSVQTLTLNAADKDTVIRCIADLNDLRDVMTKELPVKFSGSVIHTAVTSLMTCAVLLSWFTSH